MADNEGVQYDPSKSQGQKENAALHHNVQSDVFTRGQALQLAVSAGAGLAWDDAHILKVAKTFEKWVISGEDADQ